MNETLIVTTNGGIHIYSPSGGHLVCGNSVICSDNLTVEE